MTIVLILISNLLIFAVFLAGYYFRDLVEKHKPKETPQEAPKAEKEDKKSEKDIYTGVTAIANYSRRSKHDKDQSN